MSLQLVANHLAQKGRGPDSTLVHMSNREVAGLQALAQKHGGQLSVNPDTGLPEAGFLDNILPMVAGAGLTAFTGIDPMTSAAIIGGITALDSKDLSKGLVAGLGAYGGGSLANGLLDSGISTLTQQGIADAGGAAALGPEGASAIAGDVAGQSTLAKLGAGAMSPGQTLATMGGGSMMRGGLPILAGLAPAITEAFDEEEGDEAPAQHKGYIRKYALDPVTGQYKQVGAYEAGGDPNVDVSSKAGTAGAFGGVGQSEYEAAQGMAEGGTATDSSRIYDYLMGRGPNPMQFTHTQSPQVDYNVNKTPAPITPTTPILEDVYDPYGNIQRGGNYDPEKREAELNAVNDYLNVDNDGMTLNKYFALSSEKRADLDARAAEASPIRAGVLKSVTTLGTPMLFTAGKALYNSVAGPGTYLFNRMNADKMNVPNLGTVQSSINEGSTGEFGFGEPTVFGGYPNSTPNPYSMGPGTEGFNRPSTQSAPSEGNAGEQNARNYQAAQAEGERSAGETNERSFGPSDAHGGYLQHGQFDQRMARGGLPAPGAFYRKGKYNYKGPQVYADGGGIANLHQYNLGSYSDGGRLLKGPGDGVSDDIPATIGHGQPARLADGEFVIPARIVSEIGNGSTDAGARELYKMMDRVQAGRKKTVGKDQVAKNSKSVRHLPA